MIKTSILAEKNKNFRKNQRYQNLSKTDVKLLSIDKYVGNLLSNLAMNSFKPSSIAH